MIGAAKLGSLFAAIAFIAIALSVYVAPVTGQGIGPAAHDNSADIQPEWSTEGVEIDYTVTLCNVIDGNDSIDEVRLYETTGYTITVPGDKYGWYRAPFNPVKKHYQYTALNDSFFINAGECEDFTFKAITPLQSGQACNLSWKFETRDVWDVWKAVYAYTSVDKMAPNITKQVIGPQQGPCPPGQGEECWLTSGTDIDILVTDQGICQPPSGLDWCKITYTLDGGAPITIIDDDLDGEQQWQYTVTFDDQDSVHVLSVECQDRAGNNLLDVETFRRDDTPPVTSKWFEGPQKIENGIEWIDGVSTVVMDAVDPDPTGYNCNIEGVETYYYNMWIQIPVCGKGDIACVVPDPCSDVQACQDMLIDKPSLDSGVWTLYQGPIQKEEESCHVLYYYSVDALGNTEDMKVNCFYVDKTPPTLTKIIDEPEVPAEGTGVSYDLSITGTAISEIQSGGDNDGDIRIQADLITAYPPSNEGRIVIPVDSFRLKDLYTIEWDAEVMMGYAPHVDVLLDFNEDGVADDALVFEYAKVNPNDCDDAADYPTGSIDTFDDKGIVDDTAYAWLNSGPAGPCGDPSFIHGSLADWKAGLVSAGIDGMTKVHSLEIEVDGWIAESESFISSIMLNGLGMRTMHWVNSSTQVTLECYDNMPHPSGGERICYKVSFDDPATPYMTSQYCSQFGGEMEGEWCCADVYNSNNQYPFYFTEDSMHDLVYYCEDAVLKRTPTYLQYYKVDNQPPKISKSMIGTDHIAVSGTCPPAPNSQDKCYVRDDGKNGVRVDVADDTAEGCAVDNVWCTYELWWSGDNATPTQLGKFDESGVDILFTKDSMHMLIVDCWDALGNKMTQDIEVFWVDSTPPETVKTYGPPYKIDPYCEAMAPLVCSDSIDPNCENDYMHQQCTWWISTSSDITLDAKDAKIGVEKIYYRNQYFPNNPEICDVSGVYGLNGVGAAVMPPGLSCHPESYSQSADYDDSIPWNEANGALLSGATVTFQKDEDSCHVIEYYSEDWLGNVEPMKWQCVYVDDIAPVGVKTVGDPKISCSDPGMVITSASLPRTGDVYSGDGSSSISTLNGDPCSSATNPNQCAYVPATSVPPFVADTMIVQGAVPNESCGNILILSSGDPLDADTDLSTNMGNLGCGTNPDGYSTYDCTIIPGYTPSANSVVLAISSEYPEYLSSSYTDWMQIGGIVDISINSWVGDPTLVSMPTYGPSDSGSVTLATVAASQSADLKVADSGDHILDTALIVVPVSCFSEEPEPVLCGNGVVEPGEECDDGNKVSGDGCSATCLLEQPAACGNGVLEVGEECDDGNNDNGDGCSAACKIELAPDCTWVRDHVTPITLDCADQGPHPVGQETMCYRVSFDDPARPWLTKEYCGNFTASDGTYGAMTGPNDDDWCCVYVGDDQGPLDYTFTFMEDSEHDLEFYCEDHLGNAEPVPDLEYFKVDSVPPEINKIMNGPYYGTCPPTSKDDDCYVDTATSIDVDAPDGGPVCAVGGVTCKWKYKVFNPIDKIILDSLDLDLMTDADIEALGGGDGWSSWNYTFPIIFPEESYHLLLVKCEDALGNKAWDFEKFIVDKTPPEITKVYGSPSYPKTIDKQTPYPHYISSLTPITISAVDPEPHPSGLKELKYRVGIVNDADCWDDNLCQNDEPTNITIDWTTIASGDNFTIAEDSCHLIEIYAEDNVGKNSIHKQCVFVDNQPPTPIKVVEEPSTEWHPVDVAVDPLDPDATHFYPWIADRCWNGLGDQIDCWKVTLDTKISMTCEDPQPHPVDHEQICFKIELDGEDVTDGSGCGLGIKCGWSKGYCDYYGGEINDLGWCCVDHEIDDFRFKEESEHNLAFYCVDALDNGGPDSDNWIIDEEKFKVEGRMFKIQLNDKWNLISVPFVLLNDDPEEVFEDASSVQTVYSYDENGNWHVYRPGEDLTNNLESIEPGLGYWVLSDCNDTTNQVFELSAEDFKWGCDNDKCEMLVVGGSLYSAGPVTPPSQDLSEGWNLIGYYGTDGKWKYTGPDSFKFWGDTKEAFCELYSLRNLAGGDLNPTKWSALVGYWEPDNPNQWYNVGFCDKMDPGAGYWVSMDANGSYKPETVCEESILEQVCTMWPPWFSV